MPRIKHTVEQIITKLREAEVALSKGQSVVQVCRTLRDPRFRGRWSEAEGPMRPHLVIVLPPAFHEDLYLPECSKQFSIQQFIA